MTSDLKIKANRANARASTGPKTRYGRTRSARNAFRHGLNVSVQADEVLCEEVQALALEIAGSYANARIQALAQSRCRGANRFTPCASAAPSVLVRQVARSSLRIGCNRAAFLAERVRP